MSYNMNYALAVRCISAYALERNEELRAIFMNSIAEIAPDPEMLMFGDEAAKDERTIIRRYGRSKIGIRYVKLWYYLKPYFFLSVTLYCDLPCFARMIVRNSR
ncbi:hypothetical protein BDR07DRAFT_1415761 [Suillus spraguei]|nr:hypothetical protein BDR07DRAFT_1415761 [Suillus spraguei]